jgi:hypothetical protein
VTVLCIVSCKQKSDKIDIYDLLDYMTELVRYIEQPLTSKQDIEDTDFIYFLFYLSYKENQTECELIEYKDTDGDPNSFGYGHERRSNQHTVSADILIGYMKYYFGVGEEYFDKYKNGSYKYRSSHDFYDAETDAFKFITTDSYSYGSSGDYSISRGDTKIYITGNEITVKTMYLYDYYNNDLRYSADYKFTVNEKDGKIYYRLNSVDIYEDKRNKNMDVILSVDGKDYIASDYKASWFIVERNGKNEYYVPRPFQPAGFHVWDWAYQPPTNDGWIMLAGVKNTTAYYLFGYKSIYDVYVYDIVKNTGYFMSGASADNFSEYYKEDIEYYENYSPAYGYFSKFIVSMPPDSDFVLMMRSKNRSASNAGEYYMLNLKTGEETYLCDSYTRDFIISYMEEYYVWIDENHLQISVFLEGSHPTYEAVYNDKTWVTKELQGE